MILKVCGLKDSENISQILQLPVDWVGFIFHQPSPRSVDYDSLSNCITQDEERWAGKKRVGVFVNHPMEFILNASGDFGLDYAQLHGDESPDYLRELSIYKSALATGGFELIKAVSGSSGDLNVLASEYAPYCSYLLIDTKDSSGAFGGTGTKFNWRILEEYSGPLPFILSGGIGPEDAEAILELNHPMMAGIDLNSRFEIDKGIKNTNLLREFIDKINT